MLIFDSYEQTKLDLNELKYKFKQMEIENDRLLAENLQFAENEQTLITNQTPQFTDEQTLYKPEVTDLEYSDNSEIPSEEEYIQERKFPHPANINETPYIQQEEFQRNPLPTLPTNINETPYIPYRYTN